MKCFISYTYMVLKSNTDCYGYGHRKNQNGIGNDLQISHS